MPEIEPMTLAKWERRAGAIHPIPIREYASITRALKQRERVEELLTTLIDQHPMCGISFGSYRIRRPVKNVLVRGDVLCEVEMKGFVLDTLELSDDSEPWRETHMYDGVFDAIAAADKLQAEKDNG